MTATLNKAKSDLKEAKAENSRLVAEVQGKDQRLQELERKLSMLTSIKNKRRLSSDDGSTSSSEIEKVVVGTTLSKETAKKRKPNKQQDSTPTKKTQPQIPTTETNLDKMLKDMKSEILHDLAAKLTSPLGSKEVSSSSTICKTTSPLTQLTSSNVGADSRIGHAIGVGPASGVSGPVAATSGYYQGAVEGVGHGAGAGAGIS